nr:uncharacterized protein LOC105495646 [Macaca nemestrina]
MSIPSFLPCPAHHSQTWPSLRQMGWEPGSLGDSQAPWTYEQWQLSSGHPIPTLAPPLPWYKPAWPAAPAATTGMLWLLLVVLQKQVTWSKEIRASLLYPYGLEHGDQVLPAEDDDFSEKLRLLDPFMLFEATHRTAYVSALALTVRSLGSLSSPHLTLNSEPVYIYSSWLLLASSSVLLGRALSLFGPLPCQHPPAGLVLPHFPQFCTKGLVSFGEPVALFTLEAFPRETGQDFAVPFWADGSRAAAAGGPRPGLGLAPLPTHLLRPAGGHVGPNSLLRGTWSPAATCPKHSSYQQCLDPRRARLCVAPGAASAPRPPCLLPGQRLR